MTFENAGDSEMGRCVLYFFGIGIILAIFLLVGSHPSVDDKSAASSSESVNS